MLIVIMYILLYFSVLAFLSFIVNGLVGYGFRTGYDIFSPNFECGFISTSLDRARYRINYWIICFHFLLFELELFLVVFIIFSIGLSSELFLALLLFGILSVELLF